ncbi:uncharacterized protein B0J16DRAFT_381634 [Fusarium flagelliforme]|uniref:uncharacterized protein n=1 Tax=Fusarium flagelliforme TaxID=2675880 RepID=UPI001E8E01D6|nr:uncharacterized protein B0J16DRAFT_381634 [Fusarium flagelliforme]KAH7193764.1 hypothetical protein B0J16DRAFT_381634 [Fusarium flagelliforme]
MELFSDVDIERDFPDHEIRSILNRSEQATRHRQFPSRMAISDDYPAHCSVSTGPSSQSDASSTSPSPRT